MSVLPWRIQNHDVLGFRTDTRCWVSPSGGTVPQMQAYVGYQNRTFMVLATLRPNRYECSLVEETAQELLVGLTEWTEFVHEDNVTLTELIPRILDEAEDRIVSPMSRLSHLVH